MKHPKIPQEIWDSLPEELQKLYSLHGERDFAAEYTKKAYKLSDRLKTLAKRTDSLVRAVREVAICRLSSGTNTLTPEEMELERSQLEAFYTLKLQQIDQILDELRDVYKTTKDRHERGEY